MNDLDLKKKIIIGVGIVCIISLSIYFAIHYYNELKTDTKEVTLDSVEIKEKNKEKKETEEEVVKVDIKGEVKKPNIYTMPKDSRVIDVINKAGGLTKIADTSMLNLSKKIKDEMVIIIYSTYEVKDYLSTKEEESKKQELCESEEVKNDACIDSDNNTKEEETTTLININTATKEQLQTLPRIGEAKAQNIISYREKNGNFKAIEDLKNVSGIGDSIFDQIKDLITI